MNNIYLDNNATTRPAPEVLEAMMPWLEEHYGNASSMHKLGVEAGRALRQSRETLAGLMGVHPKSIVFTSGGTEGNNLAIKGLARMRKRRGRHVVTTAVEHSSVLNSLGQLKKEGFEITLVAPDREGLVAAGDILAGVREDTILVSMMHVNNETGAILPVSETARLVKDSFPDMLFHSDAVQSFGKTLIDLQPLDACTISGHKIHAPKGVGALYLNERLEPEPLLAGGGHEFGRRSGTENVPGIVALARAGEWMSEHLEPANARMKSLKKLLMNELRSLPGFVVNTPPQSVPGTLNVSFPPIPGEVLLNALSDEGICVSTGSACSSGREKGSHVLDAMGRSQQEIASSIRFSMSGFTRQKEIEKTAEVISRIFPRLKKVASLQR